MELIVVVMNIQTVRYAMLIEYTANFCTVLVLEGQDVGKVVGR